MKRCSPTTAPGVVEHLHPDVVEVDGAVHGRAAVGLGEDEQPAAPAPSPDRRRQLGERDRLADGRRAGCPGRCPATALERLAVVRCDQPVLAVAEEREVVVGEPVEQVDRLADLGRRRPRPARRGVELRGEPRGPADHPRPVLDRLAHVAEHPSQFASIASQVVRRRAPSRSRCASTTRPSGALRRSSARRRRPSPTSSSAPTASRRTTSSGGPPGGCPGPAG